MMTQDAPFAVQIEPTEGCNLRCPFCGLNGMRGKDNDFKSMSVETADRRLNILRRGCGESGIC